MKRTAGRIKMWAGIIGLVLIHGLTSGVTAEMGVAGDSVKVGACLDMTGPVAFVGKVLADGMNVYFSAVNEQGGIHGRRITQIVEDTGYNPSRAVASVVKLADRDQVFAIVGSVGTAPTLAMIPAVEKARIPLVGIGAFSPSLAEPPRKYVFHVLTNYDDQMRIGLDYVVNDLGAKNLKLGIIYQDDDFGTDCLKGLERQAQMYGIPITGKVSYKRGTIDFNPQVVRMIQAGVDYCFLATIYRETAGVLKEAEKLGWKPSFIISSAATDPMTLNLSGPAAEGLMGVFCGELADSDRSGWKQYLEKTQKYSQAKPGFYHSVGYLFGMVFCEGLKLTGKDLTRENFVKAMEKIKNLETGVGPNITFGPNLRAGAHAAYVVKADTVKGHFQKLTDWREPKEKP